MYTHHLHASGMPADFVQADTRRDRCIPLMKNNAIFVDKSNHACNVVHFKGTAKAFATHQPTCCKRHLVILKMKLSNGKLIKRTNVIVMQMGDHDFCDVFGVNP